MTVVRLCKIVVIVGLWYNMVQIITTAMFSESWRNLLLAGLGVNPSPLLLEPLCDIKTQQDVLLAEEGPLQVLHGGSLSGWPQLSLLSRQEHLKQGNSALQVLSGGHLC